MEIKKTPKADGENKRGLFLEIGLIVALGLVIAAFSITPKEHRIEKIDVGYMPVETEMTEITRQDQKPPEAPKKVDMNVLSDMLDIVTNDTKIETEITFDEFNEDEVIEIAPVEEEEIIEEEIFVTAEKMPSFMGGDLSTFNKWVQARVKYPAIAAENGVSGKVFVKFVVEKDGTLGKIEVLRSPDKSLSEEVTRVLKTSPKWEPAMQRNRPVRLTFTMPVNFQIMD